MNNNRFKFRLCYTAQDGSKTIHYTDDRILIDLNGVIYENYGKDWKSPMWETVFDAAELPFIQQFTGLTDKNNKEVYEGDILEWKGEFLAEVYWSNADSGFCIRTTDGGGAMLNHDYILNFEVVGNIFEDYISEKDGKLTVYSNKPIGTNKTDYKLDILDKCIDAEDKYGCNVGKLP